MKFMTLWTDDWIAGTHPLSPEERGVLITIVCHFTNKDMVVPDDDVYLARLCNMSTRSYRRVKKALIDGDYMGIKKGHLWIERSANQLQKDQVYSKKQAEKAKKKARYERGKSLNLQDCDYAIPSPSPSPIEVTTVTSPPNPPKQKRGSRIPDDWNPSDDDRATARAEGYSDQQIDRLGACFRDYWAGVPGAKGVKLTWSGTWRNYVRGPVAKSQSGGNGYSQGGNGANRPLGGTLGAAQEILDRWRSEDSGG